MIIASVRPSVRLSETKIWSTFLSEFKGSAERTSVYESMFGPTYTTTKLDILSGDFGIWFGVFSSVFLDIEPYSFVENFLSSKLIKVDFFFDIAKSEKSLSVEGILLD